MAWRVQWRTTKVRKKQGIPYTDPSEIKQEDGHTWEDAVARAREAIEQGACWAWIENLDSNHAGKSVR